MALNVAPRSRWASRGCLVVMALVAGSSVAAQRETPDPSVAETLAALEAGQAALLKEMESLTTRMAELRSLLRAPVADAGPPRPGHVPADPVPLTWAHLKGSAQARIVVIEYSDFQCPYCAAFFRDTFPELEAAYVDRRTIQFAYWNLPLVDLHPRALRAAVSAECAANQGRFWEMHDRLFSDPSRLDDPSLVDRARALDLDVTRFTACLDAGTTMRKVQEQASAAARILVAAGTPTFLVGRLEPGATVKVVRRLDGARDVRTFRGAIDGLLEAQG